MNVSMIGMATRYHMDFSSIPAPAQSAPIANRGKQAGNRKGITLQRICENESVGKEQVYMKKPSLPFVGLCVSACFAIVLH